MIRRKRWFSLVVGQGSVTLIRVRGGRDATVMRGDWVLVAIFIVIIIIPTVPPHQEEEEEMMMMDADRMDTVRWTILLSRDIL